MGLDQQLSNITKISYILREDLLTYRSTSAGIVLVPNEGKGMTDFIFTMGSARLNITTEHTDDGFLYKRGLVFQVPFRKSDFTHNGNAGQTKYDNKPCICLVELSDGAKYILGDLGCPMYLVNEFGTNEHSVKVSGEVRSSTHMKYA